MGTALSFKEESRACFVAVQLLIAGHGVLWDPKLPHVVMTSEEQPEIDKFIKEHPGKIHDWKSVDIIDRDT